MPIFCAANTQKGYSDIAKDIDQRLRGPVNEATGKTDPYPPSWLQSNNLEELAIDPNTGMKNYISNEGLGIDTSLAFIRKELQLVIELGRQGKHDENERNEVLRHLGTALHTLEDLRSLPEDCNFRLTQGRLSSPFELCRIVPLTNGSGRPQYSP